MPIPDFLIEEWKRLSIPCWRRRLREARETGDKNLEEYALRMLRDFKVEEVEQVKTGQAKLL
jgi:hypothetical protein